MSYHRSLIILPFAACGLAAQAQEKITYNDHVRAVLENKCFSCHNPDKKKGDLDLTSFAGAMTGGGGGAVVNPGDAEGSKLIATTKKTAEPFMPPEGAPLSAAEIEILSKWVNGGVLETASSIAKKGAPKSNLALAVATGGKPEGPLPMPENVLLEPVISAPRATAVTAMAANPWSPLVAISGLKQALVYDTNTKVLAGVYPYPEGYIRSLKFSQSGALLIAGGGRGGKSGNAVVWDVKTGKRVAEAGKEFDAVMSADISANQAMIAIGSPSKKVKVFNTSTGEELYVIKKHTEWVLAVGFSPDGILLASGDRNGNVMVTEAATGGEFYLLDGHKAACNGVAWRSDSNVLASCGEDGKIITYEMENGKVVKTWDAHPGGVLAVAFAPDGTIVSSGRDGMIRTWDINGTKKAESKKQADIVTEVAGVSDSKLVASGDWQGQVKLWSADKFEEVATLSSNPPPLAQRIIESERYATELVGKVPAAEEAVKQSEEGVKAKEAQIAELRKKLADTEAQRNQLDAEIKNFPNTLASLDNAVKDARTKRQAQVDLLKKHEQLVAQQKELEGQVGKFTEEKAKLTAPEQAPQVAEQDKKIAEANGKLEGVKKETATAPQALANFEKAVKDAQDQVTAFNTGKPARQKALEDAKKAVEAMPKGIAESEKQLAESRVALTGTQDKLKELRAQLALYQKLPSMLRAAQFNVNVLAEREKLEKMEGDLVSYQEALKDSEAAKVAAARRIEDSKKAIADATVALPAFEAALAKVSSEMPGVEKNVEPIKMQEAQVAGQVEEQKKLLAQKETEQKTFEQEKANRIAAAAKAVTDINNQIAVLAKQRGEVGAKLDAPGKVAAEKQQALAKAQEEFNTSQKANGAAAAALAKNEADVKGKDAEVAAVKARADAAEKAVNASRTTKEQEDKGLTAARAIQPETDTSKAAVAASEKKAGDAATQLATTEQAMQAVKGELATVSTPVDALRKSLSDAQGTSKEAAAKVVQVEKTLAQAKAEFEKAEKAAAPLKDQLASLT
ncbi:MAG: c-type cytochrome domain-containing protein, partial [Verrucomicrobium sp.]